MDDAIARANGGAEEGEELASQERVKAAPRKRNARGQPVAEGLAPLHVDLATLLASGGQQPKAGLLCLIRTCPSRSKNVRFANELMMKQHLTRCAGGGERAQPGALTTPARPARSDHAPGSCDATLEMLQEAYAAAKSTSGLPNSTQLAFCPIAGCKYSARAEGAGEDEDDAQLLALKGVRTLFDHVTGAHRKEIEGQPQLAHLVKSVPCTWDSCTKVFWTTTQLESHVKDHERVKAKRGAFPCPCGLSYSSAVKLAAHAIMMGAGHG